MRLALLSFFFFLSSSAFTQVTVSGKVIGEGDGEILAYSSISSVSSQTGVLADQEGNFTLSIDKKDSIVISFIGYTELRLSSREASSMNQFKLSSTDFKIEEVIVKPIDADEVMRLADSLNIENHYKPNTVQSGFYKEMLYKDREIFKVTEAAFGRYMYQKDGKKKSDIYVRKARATIDSTGLRDLNQLFNLKRDTITISAKDFIGFGQSVTYKGAEESGKNKKEVGVNLKTKFEYNGIVEYLGEEAYDITYKAYKGKKEMMDGRFLIHTDSYAYLAFEMYLNKEANLDKMIPFAVRAILSVLGYSFDINDIEYKVYYRPHDGQWFTDKSIVLIDLSVAKGGNWVNSLVKSEYYMANPRTVSSIPDFGKNSVEDFPAEDYSSEYWAKLFHIPTSERTQEIAAGIAEKNKNFSGSILSDRHEKWLKKQARKKLKRERRGRNKN